MIQEPSLTSGDDLVPAATDLFGPDPANSPAVSRSSPTRVHVPLLGAALICLASGLVGVVIDHQFLQIPTPPPRIALAEPGAVVLEALLNRPDLDSATARRFIGQTVAAVVSKYEQEGYLVVNANPGPDGQMVIEAVPNSAIDITQEMRSAVARAVLSSASAPPLSALASAMADPLAIPPKAH